MPETNSINFCAYKNDYIYMCFPKKIRNNPVYFAVFYFIVSYIGMYVIGYITGQYYGNPSLGILPMQSYIIDNINLAFLAPVGAGLLGNLYNQIERTLSNLKNDKIINKNEINSLNDYLNKMEKYYTSKFAFFIALILSVLINTYNHLNKTSNFLSIEGGITGAYGRFFIILNFTIIFLIIYKYFITLKLLNGIFKKFELKISPLHPDHSGGLKSIGDLAISANYFMALIALYVTLGLVFDELARSTPVYVTFLLLFYPVAIISFFGSLAGGHKLMLTKKNEVLKKLNNTFEYLLKTEAKNNTYDIDKLDKVSNIETLYKIAKQMPVWPFDAATLKRFITSFALPLLVYIIDKIELINKLFK